MTVVKLADAKRPALPEIGRTGTQFMTGFLRTDEYVPELMGVKALQTFDKMRRSDGMVAAALAALKLPLLSATWEIEPASADAADVAIAQQLESDLFDGMSMTWQDHLRQVFTHLDLGHYVCEIVWDPERERPDGRPHFGIRKLAPRLQRTIAEWQIEDDGGLRGIKQSIYGSGSFRTQEIPIEKLLVFVNEKEGANWVGKSVLRPAYKHWYIKDELYRIQAIAAERHGVGIPQIVLPEHSDDSASLSRAEEIGASVGAHEKGYVVMPFGWKFDLVGIGQGRALDVLPMVQHHDRMIAVSVLAPQLTLGERPEGSFALSEDQSSFFMMVLRARSDYVCDVHNRYLIPQWVRFNYGDGVALPKLRVGSLETRNVGALITAVSNAANAGLITPDPELENTLRDLAGLPPRDADAPPPADDPEPPAPDDDESAFRREVRTELKALRERNDNGGSNDELEVMRAEARANARRQEEALQENTRAQQQLATALAQREERPIELTVQPAEVHIDPGAIAVNLTVESDGETVKEFEYGNGPNGQLVAKRVRTQKVKAT